MALKFRLKGLAETFLDEVMCPGCGSVGDDDENFATEHTRVTFGGIVVVAQCKKCHEIFVPNTQRCGVINASALRDAVEQDSIDTGESVLTSLEDVRLTAERLNAERKSEGLH